jgi:hypothetical protein
MRMRRAQHIGASLADKLYVIDIAAGAAHQVRVFVPRDRLANSKITHGHIAAGPQRTPDRLMVGCIPGSGRIYRAMPSQVKGYPGRLNFAARIMVRHAR